MKAWAGLIWFMWVRPGMMRKIFADWAAFFLPGFHPWNADDRHLVAQYLAKEAQSAPEQAAKRVRGAAG